MTVNLDVKRQLFPLVKAKIGDNFNEYLKNNPEQNIYADFNILIEYINELENENRELFKRNRYMENEIEVKIEVFRKYNIGNKTKE